MSRKTDLQQLIINHTRRLQKLKEQQALKGHDAEPALLIEVEDVEAQLERLQTELVSLANEPELMLTLPADEMEAVKASTEEEQKKGGRVINTGGGAYIEGIVNTGGGDFVGRDRITYGDADANKGIAKVFRDLYQALDKQPDTLQKEMAHQAITMLEKEANNGEQADENKIKQGFEVILAMLPDIAEVAINTFINPIQGLSTAFQQIAQNTKENLKP